jgi:phosphate/sulfate permease
MPEPNRPVTRQVFCACLKSFAHGSNDVANAIGPFAAVLMFYTIDPSADDTDAKPTVPIWVLFGGGVGIVLGLATWGHKVMKTIGSDLTNLEGAYSRGFSVELGSALSVIIFSELSVPISSTHCQVGSVLGVGTMGKRLGVGGNATGAELGTGGGRTVILPRPFLLIRNSRIPSGQLELHS